MTNLPSPARERTLALQKRSFDFACGVVKAFPKRPYVDDATRVVWRELIKAATSSTFNLEEADAASSDKDFLAKMRIALREAKESRVAIRVIVACELGGHAEVADFEDEADQLARIFATIVINKLASMKRKARS